MDTEQARTFLTVIAAGNFNAASRLLNVTQSTVSARIKALEDNLGCRLFTRNKAGAVLTPQGRQFQKHASTLVRTAALARQDVGIPRGFRASLNVAARFGLWEQFLQDWLPAMRQLVPDVSIRAEVGVDDEIMQWLVEGRTDLGLLYTPQSRPGLEVVPLFNEVLVLLSADAAQAGVLGPDYIYVDWGPEFYTKHSASFADYEGPALTANVGWLALQHILRFGGSAYLPLRLAARHIQAGRLHRVAQVPSFQVSAYVAHTREIDPQVIGPAMGELRRLAAWAENMHEQC
jgi:DNA-binding transcriptional LysR family regulator